MRIALVGPTDFLLVGRVCAGEGRDHLRADRDYRSILERDLLGTSTFAFVGCWYAFALSLPPSNEQQLAQPLPLLCFLVTLFRQPRRVALRPNAIQAQDLLQPKYHHSIAYLPLVHCLCKVLRRFAGLLSLSADVPPHTKADNRKDDDERQEAEISHVAGIDQEVFETEIQARYDAVLALCFGAFAGFEYRAGRAR